MTKTEFDQWSMNIKNCWIVLSHEGIVCYVPPEHRSKMEDVPGTNDGVNAVQVKMTADARMVNLEQLAKDKNLDFTPFVAEALCKALDHHFGV